MKRLLIFLVFVLINTLVFAQGIINNTNPGNFGTGFHRIYVDSIVFLPAGCGIPSGALHFYNEQGNQIRLIAIKGDTCGHHAYWYDPSDSTWSQLDGGGSGGSGTRDADSLLGSPVDTSGRVSSQMLYWNSTSHSYKFRTIDSFDVVSALGVMPIRPADTVGKWVGNVKYSGDTLYIQKGSTWSLVGVITAGTGGYDSTIMEPKYRVDTMRTNLYAGLNGKFSIANNLSEGVPGTMRTNLGLKSAALVDTGRNGIQAATGADLTNVADSLASTLHYQTVQSTGTSQTQRAKLNFGSNMTVTDNSGNGSTDVAVGTLDSSYIPSFSYKVRGLFHAGNYTIYNPATGTFDLSSNKISGIPLGSSLYQLNFGYGFANTKSYNGSDTVNQTIDTASAHGIASKDYVAAHGGSGGSGGTSGSADSIRHVRVDTTGMRNGYQQVYNYNTNTFQYQQANTHEGYLGILYQKHWPQASDFTSFGTASITNSGGRAYISGGAGFGSGVILNAYGVTRLSKWKFYVRIIDSVAGFGIGAGIKSINTYTSLHLASRIDLSAADNSTTYLYGGTNSSSLTQLGTTSTGANPATGDTIEISTVLNDDTVWVSTYNHRGIYTYTKYAYNLWNPTLYAPNAGNFTLWQFGGGYILDSISISSDEIKNAQTCLITDSKGTLLLDSAKQYGFAQQLNLYIPTSISWSRGSDRSTEALAALPEQYLLSPKQVILPPFSNDLRSGMSQSTSTTNYIALYDSLTNHGIKVIPAYPFYETSVSQATQYAMIAANFPASQILDLWNPIASNPTKYLSNGNSDGIHPNRYGIDTCVRRVVEQKILQGGVIQSNGYVQVSPPLQQPGNINMSGLGTFAGGLSLGATGGYIFKGQIASGYNGWLFKTSNSDIGFGGFVDNGSNSIGTMYYGAPLKFGYQQGSTTFESGRIDTAYGGMMYLGTTTDDGSHARYQATTTQPSVMSLTSTNTTGARFVLKNTSTQFMYAGAGDYATGGTLNDAALVAISTGKLFFGGQSGAYMGSIDNGQWLIRNSYTNNGYGFQLGKRFWQLKDSLDITAGSGSTYIDVYDTTLGLHQRMTPANLGTLIGTGSTPGLGAVLAAGKTFNTNTLSAGTPGSDSLTSFSTSGGVATENKIPYPTLDKVVGAGASTSNAISVGGLTTSGPMVVPVTVQSGSSYTVGANDVVVIMTGLSPSLTFPSPSTVGRVLIVKYRNASGNLTLVGTFSSVDANTMAGNGAASSSQVFVADGSAWNWVSNY